MSEHPDVVFVLGGPGAGKGTQCQFIVTVSYHAMFTCLVTFANIYEFMDYLFKI